MLQDESKKSLKTAKDVEGGVCRVAGSVIEWDCEMGEEGEMVLGRAG